MQYGTIPGVGKKVSRIIQGSTMIWMEGAFEVLDRVFEQGINAIDTAQIYGNEGKVAEWIHSRGIRDQMVIITKGAHYSSDSDGTIHRRCNEKGITEDIMGSLEKLQVDFIDLYILHRDDPNVPVSEIVDCLNRHKKEGRIQAFGGSNWTYKRIREANAYAAANKLTPFVVTNPNFSLAEMYDPPWAECISISGPQGEEARKWYLENNMTILAWSSMAAGFWSGNFTREMYKTNPDEIPELVRRCYCGDTNFTRLDRAGQLAKEKGVSIPMIAIAYMFNLPQDIYTLIAPRSGDECAENIKALDIKLTPKEISWLELKQNSY